MPCLSVALMNPLGSQSTDYLRDRLLAELEKYKVEGPDGKYCRHYLGTLASILG